MKSLDELENDAIQRRLQFSKTLKLVNQRTQLPQLVDEVLALLPHRDDNSPLTSIGVAGATWLIKELVAGTERPPFGKPKNRRLK
jgi:hypothetical protein